MFLIEHVKLDSYSPNEDSSLIRQVITDFSFSQKARNRLHGVYGKKLAVADSAKF